MQGRRACSVESPMICRPLRRQALVRFRADHASPASAYHIPVSIVLLALALVPPLRRIQAALWGQGASEVLQASGTGGQANY